LAEQCRIGDAQALRGEGFVIRDGLGDPMDVDLAGAGAQGFAESCQDGGHGRQSAHALHALRQDIVGDRIHSLPQSRDGEGAQAKIQRAGHHLPSLDTRSMLPSSVSGAGGQVAEAGMFQTRTNIPFTIHSCQVPSFCTPRFGRNAKRGNTFQRTPWTIPSPHSLPPVIVEKYWVAWHSGCIFPLLEYFADLLLMMPPTPETLNRFLARQPILTSKRKLFGYEILSRYGPENYCRPMAGEQFH